MREARGAAEGGRVKSLGREPKTGQAGQGTVTTPVVEPPASQALVTNGTPASRPSQHKPNWLGKPGSEMRAEEAKSRDSQPISTACLFCDWTFEGTAGEARAEARVHREKHHPEAAVRKPRSGRRITKRHLRSAEEQEQISLDAAEANRARLEREDAERLAKVLRAQARGVAA